MTDTPGYRWVVCWGISTPPLPDENGRVSFSSKDADFWQVSDRRNLGKAPSDEKYATQQEAELAADEFNRQDAIASLDLDPAFAERRLRLRTLGSTFWVEYGEGHPETRWPNRPDRYAVEVFSERYSQSFWETVDTLGEVEELIRRDGAETVVDLDTGKPLHVQVSVSVSA